MHGHPRDRTRPRGTSRHHFVAGVWPDRVASGAWCVQTIVGMWAALDPGRPDGSPLAPNAWGSIAGSTMPPS